MDPTDAPAIPPVSGGTKQSPAVFTRPADPSQYIRTYAKDVALLTHTEAEPAPVPAPAPVQPPQPKRPSFADSLHLGTRTEEGVTVREMDASPVNRERASSRAFEQEAIALTKEDSAGIFAEKRGAVAVPVAPRTQTIAPKVQPPTPKPIPVPPPVPPPPPMPRPVPPPAPPPIPIPEPPKPAPLPTPPPVPLPVKPIPVPPPILKPEPVQRPSPHEISLARASTLAKQEPEATLPPRTLDALRPSVIARASSLDLKVADDVPLTHPELAPNAQREAILARLRSKLAHQPVPAEMSRPIQPAQPPPAPAAPIPTPAAPPPPPPPPPPPDIETPRPAPPIPKPFHVEPMAVPPTPAPIEPPPVSRPFVPPAPPPSYREAIPDSSPSYPVYTPPLESEFVPSVAPAVPEPIPTPLHTFSSDFATRIDTERANTFSVLAAQSDARPVAAQPAPAARSLVPLIAGIFLVVGGIGLAVGAFVFTQQASNIPEVSGVPSLVQFDESVEVSGTGAALAGAINEAAIDAVVDGNVIVTYISTTQDGEDGVFTSPQPGGVLLQALSLPAPAILLRNIDPASTVGVIRAGSESRPFIVFKVTSYERTFAGMLAWEATIANDLAGFYPPYPVSAPVVPPTSTSTLPALTPVALPFFVDVVVANHDARALRDSAGRTLMLYGYHGKDMLILARDEAAFTALTNRIVEASAQ